MSKRDAAPVLAFLASASLTVLVGVVGANAATPRPVTELAPGAPLRVRITSDADGFSYLHPDDVQSTSLLELPVNRALDVEMVPSRWPRTLRIEALGLEIRGARDRAVVARWVVPRSFRKTVHAVDCEPACRGRRASPQVLLRFEAAYDPERSIMGCQGFGPMLDCAPGEDQDVCWGRSLHGSAGCRSCHSIDPAVTSPAPSWAGSWGTTRALEGGRHVTVDAAYIRQSILQPHLDIARGYTTTQMAPYRLSDGQIRAVTRYIESLARPLLPLDEVEVEVDQLPQQERQLRAPRPEHARRRR